MRIFKSALKVTTYAILILMGGCDWLGPKADNDEIKLSPRSIIYSGDEDALNAQRNQMRQLPAPYYCLVSTLNPEGTQKAYTYKAYNLYIPKKLLKNRRNGKEDQWISFTYAYHGALARHEADSASLKNSGIVRMVRCRVPGLPKVGKKLKSQFRQFGPQSWLYQHKKELMKHGKNERSLPMECTLYERDFECSVILNEYGGIIDVYNCRFTGPWACVNWGPDDPEGGGSSSSGNESDVCETEEPTPGDPTPGDPTPGGSTPIGCVDNQAPCDTNNPGLNSIFNDPAITAAISDLWIYSNPHLPITQRVEQGGWITRNSNGDLGFVPFPVSWPNSACGIGSPSDWLNSVPANTIAWVHTHPFWKNDNTKLVCGARGTESYPGCGASQEDYDFLLDMMGHLDKLIKGYVISGSNITTINPNSSTNCYGRCSY